MKEFSIKGEHGNLRGAKWLQATNPHSTVQIIHGLAEHHKRYDLTAKALNDEGSKFIAMIILDMDYM